MNSWFILLLFGCLLIHAIGKPHRVDYNTDSDVDETEEEEDSDSAADSYSDEYEDSRLSDQGLGDKAGRNRDLHKVNPDLTNMENELKSYPKRRRLNRFNDAGDEQQEIPHLIHNDVNRASRDDNENDRSQGNKAGVALESTANDEERGDMFERNRELVGYINKQEYNTNDGTDSEQPRYFKQYYNTMQAENKDNEDHKVREAARFKFRDRRDIKESIQADNSVLSNNFKDSNGKAESEDEESAIKRHIKKLSKYELDQLLNSLPEEKRYLLKKIIADTDFSYNGFINKREITKKAGAVEENNFIENCQSDLSKIQGDSASSEISTNAPSQSSETGSSKLETSPDNSETTQKPADLSVPPENKVELSNPDVGQKTDDVNLNALPLNLDTKNSAEIIGNIQTSKTENKRETHLEDLEESDDSLEDNKMAEQDYSNQMPEKVSNVLDDESQPYEYKNKKREAYYEKQSELSDSLKSLEESFPNNYANDDSGPYSGPLIRVKRKNYERMLKKRPARLAPDTKVAFVPYKAENEDEDNDEGNEFDDEGFYDRTSYFANSNKAVDIDDTTKASENSIERNNVDNSKSLNENADSDTMSLGSDTDSVLSGVEGVDDNLMYNSGVRSRRTADENVSEATQSEGDVSTTLDQDEVKAPANSMNLPHYQENEAFGPLPRNYDVDLTRYKRVRRVKQLENPQELNSSNI